jgi:DNA-binding transcriptional regulator YiaG
MDKRFNPLSPAEELHARRVLAEELAADPGMLIPAVIRKIRASLRLTIAEYAKLCGVSARTLQDVEREVSSPTLVTAEKLLRPMGMVPGAAAKPRQR